VALAAAALLLVAPSVSRADGVGAAAAKSPPAAGAQTPQPTAAPTAPAASSLPPAKMISPDGTVEAGPFQESTTTRGTIDGKLTGVWLLVGNVQIAAGKFKSFVQLLKVTDGKSGPEFHLLDVRLPASVEKSLKESSQNTLTAWVPSAEVLKLLAQEWSKLPPAKTKALDEFLYANIDYVLASPDRYEEFPKRNDATNKILEGSKFGILIIEDYRPREQAPEARHSQLARRTSYYGVKAVDKESVKGDMYSGFLAVGAGVPLPFEWPGTFTMYKLAPL
jgi:hypothetical protein